MNKGGKKFREESSSFYNEREVRSIDYDKDAPSKENVELSLEVEIADSLKQILTSPKNCTSRLLDVTIIRPNEPSPQVETNTVAFDKHEIKDLISIIEKQKIDKRRRIEEQRKKLSNAFRSPLPNLAVSSEMTRPRSPKTVRINHQPEYINDGRPRNICSSSAPPDLTLNKNNIRPCDVQTVSGDAKLQPDYIKKLKKYKDIEGRLLEIASKSKYDSNDNPNICENENYFISQSTPNHLGECRQHVFAAQRTFDDLRKKFKCTNPEKSKADEPCVCQHCGLMGILVDGQKGPVFPATTRSATPWRPSQMEMRQEVKKNNSWKGNLLAMKNMAKPNTNNDNIMKQINIRLKSLEERVTIQEETAVTRDYFKLIMNKLLLSCRSADVCKKETSVQAGTNWSYAKNKPNINFSFKKRAPTPQNVRNEKRHYTVHHATIQQDSTETCDESLLDSDVIDIAFEKIDEVVEENVKKEKSKDHLWRWGEEIIKPGFDLKNKIMGLLEEKLQNIKSEHKGGVDTDVQVQMTDEVKSPDSPTINILPANKFFDQRGIMPTMRQRVDLGNEYKLDMRKAMDDTTFKRNIEEQRKKVNHCRIFPDRMYDSGDTSSINTQAIKRHVRHKQSRSDHDIRQMKKREVVRIETKTYIGKHGQKDYASDSSFKPKRDKHRHGYNKGMPYILERKDSNLKSQTVHVNYVNPNASSWFEESATDISTANKKSKKSKHRSRSITDKLKYLQELAKYKNVKEEVVWNNIVKQVKKYAHKRQDETVKIQVPTEVLYRIKNPSERVTEIELTLADLQDLISKSKTTDDVSSTSANTVDHRKKLQELHKHLGAMLNKNKLKFGI